MVSRVLKFGGNYMAVSSVENTCFFTERNTSRDIKTLAAGRVRTFNKLKIIVYGQNAMKRKTIYRSERTI